MRPIRIVAARAVASALGVGLLVAGCSSSEPAAAPTPSATTPKGFEVPEGVTLTPPGTAVKVGRPATVVYRVGDQAASAVTVAVTAVTKGSIDDFRFFSLDAATKTAKPYYVTVKVRNEGPAGLGGAALPIFALDSSRTNLPANDIVGTFKPCPTPTLPASFLPGATADLCLVYLVPKGRKLRSITLQTGTSADAIRWGS